MVRKNSGRCVAVVDFQSFDLGGVKLGQMRKRGVGEASFWSHIIHGDLPVWTSKLNFREVSVEVYLSFREVRKILEVIGISGEVAPGSRAMYVYSCCQACTDRSQKMVEQEGARSTPQDVNHL